MSRHLRIHLAAALLGIVLAPGVATADAGLVGWWQFEEGAGLTAADSSGNGRDGILETAGVWEPGPEGQGMALGFGGDRCRRVNCGVFDPTGGTGTFTLTLWCRWEGTPSIQHYLTKSNVWGATTAMFQVEVKGGHADPLRVDRMHLAYQGAPQAVLHVVPKNEWAHMALVFDGTHATGYLNGVDEVGPQPTGIGPNVDAPVLIGASHTAEGRTFQGFLDDVRIYSRVLTAAEIEAIMTGSAEQAASPEPTDGAVDVLRDTALSWRAGKFGDTHDVYLGTTFTDVNAAGRTDARGALASQGQASAVYTPAALLDYGTTYYWRVDEVNATADKTIHKGNVWSFTVEPYGYPIQPVKATAASHQPNMGPEKTIDGSGLTGDLHGTESTTMWLSAGVKPNWIQYEFDQVYKLHELHVWNSNQLVEGFLGFGAKMVTIETSADGTTWAPVAEVPEFGRGPGAATYAANTTVSLGDVEAQFVKLTINTNWGGMTPQSGLAEVRFFYVPMEARAPQPPDGARDVSLETVVDWRPGRGATSHTVYFGSSAAAVAAGTVAARTVATHGVVPVPMDLGTTYYWRVDEVGAATYPGAVWSFTTEGHLAVDDFEGYTSQPGEEVFATWLDGFDNPTKNGAVVGLATAVNGTFCDTTTFHGGRRSMPLAYSSTTAPLSEATRTFAPAQDWTASGITTLVLFFYGDPANTGAGLYVKVNDSRIPYDGGAGDLMQQGWSQWNIDLAGLPASSLRSVRTLTIGMTSGTGKLLIDDIGLYRVAPAVPATP